MNNAITEIKSTQIIFTIIILNSFSGRLPISSSFFGLVGIYHVPYLLNISLPFHPV